MPNSLTRLIRKVRFGRPIIVVSGLPRSGTSMAMKMLEAGGVPIVTDGIRTADDDNPKGYYEFERVKDLDKPGGGTDLAWLDGARGKTVKIISFLLEYLPPGYNYKVIFMRRDLREILASQSKMLQRRGEASETDDDRMLENYERHLRKIDLLLRREPRFEAMDIAYRDIIDSPREQARRIDEFLGLGLDVSRMAGVVDEKLYRNRAQTS